MCTRTGLCKGVYTCARAEGCQAHASARDWMEAIGSRSHLLSYETYYDSKRDLLEAMRSHASNRRFQTLQIASGSPWMASPLSRAETCGSGRDRFQSLLEVDSSLAIPSHLFPEAAVCRRFRKRLHRFYLHPKASDGLRRRQHGCLSFAEAGGFASNRVHTLQQEPMGCVCLYTGCVLVSCYGWIQRLHCGCIQSLHA